MPAPGPDGSRRPLHELVACHECDRLMLRLPIATGECAQCPRCGHVLYSHRPSVLRRGLALTIAALLLYIPACFLPLMELHLLGQHARETVWSSVLALWQAGMPEIAMVVFLCGMLIPLLKLVCQLSVLLSIRWRRGRSVGLRLFRAYHHLRAWGMLEIYLMGVLVSMVKLAGMAQLEVGVGLMCFVALLLVQVWLEVSLSAHQVWEALSGVDAHACD